jgi:tetratricopeptide (TPR) repeat protein
MLGWLYRNQGKPSQAEDLFKQAIALDPQNDRAYGALSILYEETGKPGLAKEYAQKATSLRLGHYVPLTVTNYRTLKEILDKRGIRLVCVQYPMRSVEPLKRILQGTEKGIIFVDNEKLFRDAVRKDGYNTYFKDMFGGDFGHCTDRGNRLLAENIADTIVKEAFHK